MENYLVLQLNQKENGKDNERTKHKTSNRHISRGCNLDDNYTAKFPESGIK